MAEVVDWQRRVREIRGEVGAWASGSRGRKQDEIRACIVKDGWGCVVVDSRMDLEVVWYITKGAGG